MAAGRPKGFDEREVVERAMDLFWLQGYQGAGLSELLEHMGISRQSLYDTFGSKRGLFVRVLDHYRETRLAEALALLEREGSRIENVKAVLGFFEALSQSESGRGCLVANTTVELGPHDEGIADQLREMLDVLQEGLERALREGQERGELAEHKSPPELSRALTNAILGMAVTGKLRKDPSVLSDVYAGTLSMLD